MKLRQVAIKPLFWKLTEQLEYLRFVGTSNGLAIVPVHRLLSTLAMFVTSLRRDALAQKVFGGKHTTGRWKFSALCLNSFIASS